MQIFILALAILLISAVSMIILAFFPTNELQAKIARFVGIIGASFSSCLGLFAIIPHLYGEPSSAILAWGLPFGSGSIGLDPLSSVFLLPVFVLGIVCSCSGFVALKHIKAKEHNQPGHWCFFLLLLFGMALTITARDTILFLIAWEIMSLSPFFLIDFNDLDGKVRDAAWIYLVAAHLGVIPLMIFWAYLWNLGDATNFSSLIGIGSTAGISTLNCLFLLSFLGFGAKAGLMPLHVWLPEAHPAAPSHVSAILSGAMINAGLYGIVRSFDFLGPIQSFPAWWGWLILLIGLASGLTGILKAIAQKNLKRMLAYSSVENMGIMLIGLGVGLIGANNDSLSIATLGFAAMLLHMINHAAFKGLLFLCAGEVLHATGTVKMEHLGGLQKKLPIVGIAFAIGAASIACLPPFNGFIGEFSLALALLDGRHLVSIETTLALLFSLVLLTLISGFAVVAFVKAYGIIFLGEPRSGFAKDVHAPSLKEIIPLFIPIIICIMGGLAGPLFYDTVLPAAKIIANAQSELNLASKHIIHQTRHSIELASFFCWGLILFSLIIFFIRKILLSDRIRFSSTWGCGYQFATPRIQYTSASFSEPLTWVFNLLMGLKTVTRSNQKILFPTIEEMHVSSPDRLRTMFFSPLFDYIERISNACKIIQHGKIHLYILYIFITAIALLIWGLW